MEKQKPWQLALIIAVLLITLYNILPTIIFYMRPLKAPITAERAVGIENSIASRVDALSTDAREWLRSYCSLLHVTPTSIEFSKDDPSIVMVKFADKKEKNLFQRLLPRAGVEIPFVPAQLTLCGIEPADNTTCVLRRLAVTLPKAQEQKLFHFSEKFTKENTIVPFYFDIIKGRVAAVAEYLYGAYASSSLIEDALSPTATTMDVQRCASELITISTVFDDTAIAHRYFQTLFPHASRVQNAEKLIAKFEEGKKALQNGKEAFEERSSLIEQYSKAIAILQKNLSRIRDAAPTISKEDIAAFFAAEYAKDPSKNAVYTFDLHGTNPYFSSLIIDWANESILLKPFADVSDALQTEKSTEAIARKHDVLRKEMLNAVGVVTRETDEKITGDIRQFQIDLNMLADSKSLLALDLDFTAGEYCSSLSSFLEQNWKPTHTDLASLRILSPDAFTHASAQDKKFCIAVLHPTQQEKYLKGLRVGPIYVLVRGVQHVLDQYNQFPESEEAKLFYSEFNTLIRSLQQRGFIGYSGAQYALTPDLQGDYVFELNTPFEILLKATREDFYVLGNKRYAVLEFTDVEQRIIAENRIDDAIQEDLLKWKENYAVAQASLDPTTKLLVPKPTKNAYLANFFLALKKYFRGDDSKIIRWGLDLSGGKSVRIALFDTSGHRVEKQEDLRQASNELYTRINKMGVSERTIRLENDTILLDFPGSQGLSAAELIKASAMYFHVMNEQFGPYNAALHKEVNEFLQDVWNEAVVTNRTDIDSINEIAYEKLNAAAKYQLQGAQSAASILYAKGLRLAPPDKQSTVAFDDSLSMIAKYRTDDKKDWANRTNPLAVVFKNYALEGSSLSGVQTGYDPTKGNVLYFNVKGSYPRQSGNPRDDFYTWTSQFSEEGITGTPRQAAAPHGWRMAVILNGAIISSPSLHAALSDHAMISGNFSQRDVSKLAADLRAGSLSFTPKILSENNVSPELGEQERTKGIRASLIGVLLVIVAMVGYYRFAGVVASIAVMVNILIIWAVLQNIDAALTLPGIAGIVLTVALAVDANVLVFERIREEFKISGRIAASIQAGYKKAFSAIFDSNVTTIIASVILLQFDSGPIRGFATTLIIGILSSMFTALFMTRYFFAGWVRNPNHTQLRMREWIRSPNFDFLKMTRPVVTGSILLFIAGLFVFMLNPKAMIGMDFTGGYALTVEVTPGAKQARMSIKDQVIRALENKGVKLSEIQIRELGRPDLLRIQLATSLEQPGHPFAHMAPELQGQFPYEYQKNPRIVFVVQALADAGIQIKPSSLPQLNTHWTSMSGQLSDTMRNNAIAALGLALLCVLIYIAIRFEWKYAISSVIALIHDVLLTLAIMAIANRLGAPVQLSLETIGAIMTIIGYSMNDTIIVFDRIREELRLLRKLNFGQIINHALNQTLSRTLMTSGTTFLVLLSLDCFAGSSIFGFAFVMTTGVVLGTLSSLFIASPALLWLHHRESREALPA